jgi:hypothetical protein
MPELLPVTNATGFLSPSTHSICTAVRIELTITWWIEMNPA